MVTEKPDITPLRQKNVLESAPSRRGRKAAFIRPLNLLKSKVGYGGLSDEVLNKAQAVLENLSIDFVPLGEMYLGALMRGIEAARHAPAHADNKALIAGMLYPAMQLKANGGMFRYPLVTRLGAGLMQFIEVVAAPDNDALDIILAFHTTIRTVIMGRVTGAGGKYGDELMQVLENACLRYFAHHPANRFPVHRGGDKEDTGRNW